MKLYSTRNTNHIVSFKEAVLKGLADDGGLYLPTEIPVLSPSFIAKLPELSAEEIHFEIAKKYLENDISTHDLSKIIQEVFPFELPLKQLYNDVYSLELFHGPTMAFKDVGARFMSRILAHYYQNEKEVLNIVVATSGDTGSAVAAGFYDVPGIQVFILYPKDKVSFLQEKQLTTWGKNITALEVAGTFDDCQKIVKQLLSDSKLKNKLTLTSANSINIARLIPQSFYYFSSYAQIKPTKKPVVYAIPSGNYGNITAGIMAYKMGLPIDQFIAATNVNDVVPEFLKTGIFTPRASQKTISNAIDIGNPSNFERLQALFTDFDSFQKTIKGYSYSDSQTKEIIREVYQKYQYTLDPHGAIAYLGLRTYMEKNEAVGVFFETAHPAKFKNTVDDILNLSIEIPEKLKLFADKEKQTYLLQNDYQEILEIILSKNK